MDRFIAISISPLATGGGYLKSNMDRFIAVAAYTEKEKFKI